MVSFSTAFVRTENELIANRFILGLFEGGVLTCTIVLIRKWFTRSERARANTLFLISIPLSGVIANPVSGMVLAHFDWQTMFLVEAAPGLVWSLVWIWAITERPQDAAWLDPAEKARLVAALAEEERCRWLPRRYHLARNPCGIPRRAVAGGPQLRRRSMAEWGVTFWLPTVLKETGLSITAVGWLSAIPPAAGALMMIVVAISSDRRQERKWHMIVATAMSGVFLLLAQFVGQGNTVGILVCLTFAVASFYGRFGPSLATTTEVPAPPSVRRRRYRPDQRRRQPWRHRRPDVLPGAVRDWTWELHPRALRRGRLLILTLPVPARGVDPQPPVARGWDRHTGLQGLPLTSSMSGYCFGASPEATTQPVMSVAPALKSAAGQARSVRLGNACVVACSRTRMRQFADSTRMPDTPARPDTYGKAITGAGVFQACGKQLVLLGDVR